MKRLFAVGAFLCALLLINFVWAANEDFQEKKEALQELNGYIGQWKGTGAIPTDRFKLWKETADWSWRFKKNDCYLTVHLKGKEFKKGELRYLLDDGIYQLKLINNDNKEMVFKGKLKRTRLTFERKDPKTKETQQLIMTLAGGGVRFIYTYKVKPANRTLFSEKFQVAFTKEGESLGATKRGPECIVTGGLGTSTVSYKGQTYYVCCSGCRDAFNENPEKYIAEFKKRKRR